MWRPSLPGNWPPPAAAWGCTSPWPVAAAARAPGWSPTTQSGTLEAVCPQRFAAPLAPHLAARAEGRAVDPSLLRSGLRYWLNHSDIVVVEGAGGLMSPASDDDYVADLAADFGFPLVVVARNALGTINHTLLTLIAATTFREELAVAGIVLNDAIAAPEDDSRDSNFDELAARAVPPLLGRVRHGAEELDRPVDWWALAGERSFGERGAPAP
jgi:dethiobiotin synthetase